MGFPEAVRELFKHIDKDGSGKISVQELKHALEKEIGQTLREEDVRQFMARLDTNQDGELSLEELNAFFTS
ncbi:unnamed protein product [Schistocephalus solidus]|uniref:EF hand n=1 Tax=Schistocephalus solidus TaxID=70667 RepID=A0A183SR79_SCHSO|nr:unnamed protein product [Schistocephalus solidus]